MEKISYRLDAFEGPLDLLLHLIEKNKLNIYDILISELLDQYMEHIRLMQEQDLEIAGEFLDMASRLVQIKSAKVLSEQVSFDNFCREPEKIKADMRYRRTHEPTYLVNAYLAAVGRGKEKIPPSEEAFSGIVKRRIVSVSSKIIGVMKKLWSGRSIRYTSVFEDAGDKSELVATFLAVLELIKGKRVRVEGEGDEQSLRLISGGKRRKEEEA